MSRLKEITQCQVHLSILFDEDPSKFNITISETRDTLKERFNWEYPENIIEEAKLRLEFNIPEDTVIEHEEDY